MTERIAVTRRTVTRLAVAGTVFATAPSWLRNYPEHKFYERQLVVCTFFSSQAFARAIGQRLGKVEHLRFRSTLQSRRVKRWRPVLREVATGRYALFGRGTGDILRDLFQPAGVSEGNDVTS